MKYYLDTEFHEFNINVNTDSKEYNINTIELISIGLVDENDKEYYAVCKDFDIDQAWKNTWLKENVLHPIWNKLKLECSLQESCRLANKHNRFTKQSLISLIESYGKTAEQIKLEIIKFVDNPEFYAYYADYDWVVFCWLFGRMIDLPEGFPKYCRDLKQMMDDKSNFIFTNKPKNWGQHPNNIKNHRDYPKQTSEHNALADAKWNKKLHEFLNKNI